MPQNQAYLQRVLRTAVFLVGTLLFFRFLFVPLLPFLVALCLSALLEPPVQRLRRVLGVRRSFAAASLTTALLLVLGGAAAFFALRLGAQLSEWSARLPQAIEAFPALWNNVLDRMDGWYASCPPFLRTLLDALAASLSENAPALVGKAGGFLMEKIPPSPQHCPAQAYLPSQRSSLSTSPPSTTIRSSRFSSGSSPPPGSRAAALPCSAAAARFSSGCAQNLP